MLIDCGMKSKSEIMPENTIDVIIKHIKEATNGFIDVVLVTHEHEDHVNGFNAKQGSPSKHCWDSIDIGHLWLAWTEDGDDDFANKLRDRFDDTLLGLVGLSDHMDKHGVAEEERGKIEDLLAFDERKDEPNLDFEEVLKELKASGKL